MLLRTKNDNSKDLSTEFGWTMDIQRANEPVKAGTENSAQNPMLERTVDSAHALERHI